MTRPRSDFRQQVLRSFVQRCRQPGDAVPWEVVLPDLRISSIGPAEVRLVRRTVENMVQAGELQRVGSHKPAGARAWRGLYAPAEPVACAQATGVAGLGAELLAITAAWAGGR